MKVQRSLPLTVSLLPLLLISLFFSFAGAMTCISAFAYLMGEKTNSDFSLIPLGLAAAVLLVCGGAAFKMKKWGIYGLMAMGLVFLLMTLFVQAATLPVAGLSTLPVAVAFAMKDFEQMD